MKNELLKEMDPREAGGRLATIEEAATALNVPISWLYSRTRLGTVPYIKVGKYCRFDLAELLAWAKSGHAS